MFHFRKEFDGMTHPLRNVSGFEVRSVLLFAALSFGGTAAMAQSPAPAAPSSTPRGAAAGVQRAPAATDDVQAAFDRADTNRDGQLSRKEAESLPAVSNAFEQIDADKNGSLSREEFSKAVQQR